VKSALIDISRYNRIHINNEKVKYKTRIRKLLEPLQSLCLTHGVFILVAKISFNFSVSFF